MADVIGGWIIEVFLCFFYKTGLYLRESVIIFDGLTMKGSFLGNFVVKMIEIIVKPE